MNSTVTLEYPFASLTPTLIFSGLILIAFLGFFLCCILYLYRKSKSNQSIKEDSKSSLSDDQLPKFIVTSPKWTAKTPNNFCDVKHLSDESLVYDVNMLNK